MCVLTSEEGVLEGEGVEDTEAEAGAERETALVLVETHTVDLFARFVGRCTGHQGRRVDYGSHDYQNIINQFINNS